MRKLLPLCLTLLLAACSGVGSVSQSDVRNREVPTAFFVFFEANSVVPMEGDAKVIDEVAAFLAYYDTLSVRVVGHNGKSEVSSVPGFPLDVQRSTYVVSELMNRGISASRVNVLNMGSREAMASAVGGDEAVDRRVEILMVDTPVAAMATNSPAAVSSR